MVTGKRCWKAPQKDKGLKRVIEETELSVSNKQTNEPAQKKISTAKAISHAACTVARPKLILLSL